MEINNNQPQPEQIYDSGIPIENSVHIESSCGWKIILKSNELILQELIDKAKQIKEDFLNGDSQKPSPTYTQ
jgi:hypothetical protein